MDLANPIEAALREAGAKHWCTKAICTTCGAAEFRERIARDTLRDPKILAEALAQMDLSAWYAVEQVGGAIAQVFSRLSKTDAVDGVLLAWRRRVHAHTRIIDSVLFHLVRRGIPSNIESKAWLSIAREEALATEDPSLLETLTYALGSNMAADPELLAVAHRQRRGYSPLHRAMVRIVDSIVRESDSVG